MDSIEEARYPCRRSPEFALSGDREAALAAGLAGMRRIAEALGRREYGESEPAGQFRPPQGAAQ